MALKKYIIREEYSEEKDQRVQDLINQLVSGKFRNKQKRLEFAQAITEIVILDTPMARKLIWKLGEFCSYWCDDSYISEGEWHKLNNSEYSGD